MNNVVLDGDRILNMDIKAQKSELKERIDRMEADKFAALALYLKHLDSVSSQRWEDISKEEREGIEEGLRQADNGETRSHDDVMAPYLKYL